MPAELCLHFTKEHMMSSELLLHGPAPDPTPAISTHMAAEGHQQGQ